MLEFIMASTLCLFVVSLPSPLTHKQEDCSCLRLSIQTNSVKKLIDMQYAFLKLTIGG